MELFGVFVADVDGVGGNGVGGIARLVFPSEGDLLAVAGGDDGAQFGNGEEVREDG